VHCCCLARGDGFAVSLELQILLQGSDQLPLRPAARPIKAAIQHTQKLHITIWCAHRLAGTAWLHDAGSTTCLVTCSDKGHLRPEDRQLFLRPRAPTYCILDPHAQRQKSTALHVHNRISLELAETTCPLHKQLGCLSPATNGSTAATDRTLMAAAAVHR
jgi:hypothetical protein